MSITRWEAWKRRGLETVLGVGILSISKNQQESGGTFAFEEGLSGELFTKGVDGGTIDGAGTGAG